LFCDKIDNSALSPLSEYLPFSTLGGILFTTRDHDAATRYADSDVVEVGEMSFSESKELLQKSLQNKRLLEDQDGTAMVLTLLVNLPLAIMQAAAYLNSKSTTILQYLELYKESSKNEITLLEMDFKGRWRYREMNNAVATTWIISFKQIQRQDRLAADYMRFIACIKEQDVPWDLLPELTSLQRNNALSTLKGFGFLKEQEGGRFYNMHRLVHLATQNWMRHEKLMSTWTETALRRLVNVIPYGGHQHREKWTAYIPHGLQVADSLDLLETREEERFDLFDRIGRCQSSIGQYSTAAETHRRVLELRMKVLGKEHPSTLVSMNEVGVALSYQGKYVEAEKIHQETLALSKKVLGKEHPSTLVSMNNLSQALSNQGKYVEAEKMHQETLALREKVLGKEHPSTLVSMSNLSKALSNQGKYAEAEKIHRETLALREKVLGKEHPETLESMNEVGVALSYQGKYVEAEKMYQETLALGEKALGKEHPETLVSIKNLRYVIEKQKRLGKRQRFKECFSTK
jgi:tetratricopeptide (TPR) repeat protein